MNSSYIFFLIGSIVFSVALVIILNFFAQKYSNSSAFFQEIQSKGYAIIYAEGPATWIVLILGKPSQLDFIDSDLTIGHQIAASYQIFKSENEAFNHRFFVHSNHSEGLNQILSLEVQSDFLSLPPLTFQTGSFNTLLPYYCWPKNKEERSLRKILHFKISGHQNDVQT